MIFIRLRFPFYRAFPNGTIQYASKNAKSYTRELLKEAKKENTAVDEDHILCGEKDRSGFDGCLEGNDKRDYQCCDCQKPGNQGRDSEGAYQTFAWEDRIIVENGSCDQGKSHWSGHQRRGRDQMTHSL